MKFLNLKIEKIQRRKIKESGLVGEVAHVLRELA
jgi:hypothetical protein